ncbi:MAG: hypothetical protein MZU95_04140 [Desulfomicrobium escambiense]|nr:hypothetical protein [Desulfomicrobium escambiense]
MKIGERTITIDADVIQADGGTRTASITGAYVALHDALTKLKNKACRLKIFLLLNLLRLLARGIVKGELMLDLDYDEDSSRGC